MKISFLHVLIFVFFGDKRGKKDTPCRLNVQYQGGNDYFLEKRLHVLTHLKNKTTYQQNNTKFTKKISPGGRWQMS